METRAWKPSKRAQEAIRAIWDAFEDGDRWLRCVNASTWRYTIVSLGDMVERDEEGRRFRISEELLQLNGMTRATRFFAGVSYGRILEIEEAIEQEEGS